MPTLTDKLESARLLIFNSRDPQVVISLQVLGLDEAYLSQGETLYNDTIRLMDNQRKEYQEQSQAFDTFYLEKDDAEAAYNRTVKLVKLLSRNDKDLQNRLRLTAGQVSRIEVWIETAIDFYNRVLNEKDFVDSLNRFNLTPERLNEEKEAILQLRTLRNDAIREKGQAQEATRLRNEKLDELDDYCRELKGLAELALEGQPQLLEKLGVFVRS